VAGLDPTYQAAWADFNNDGKLDLVSGGKLFQNVAITTNHWLEVHLYGDGSRVKLVCDRRSSADQAGGQDADSTGGGGHGEGNQNDLVLHFGLGARTDPVSLDIFWPNGATQRVDKRPGRPVDCRKVWCRSVVGVFGMGGADG